MDSIEDETLNKLFRVYKKFNIDISEDEALESFILSNVKCTVIINCALYLLSLLFILASRDAMSFFEIGTINLHFKQNVT